MATRVQSCITWRFVGKTRRHEVELRHNTISGKQLLTVNGEILHRINWKYKLTGNMYWECDGSVCELYIRADEDGNLHYTLTVDNKEIPLTGDRVSSTWVVALADGLHQIEFEQRTYDILVDGAKVEAVGDFVDEGSAYSFEVGTPGAGGVPATLTVVPPPDRRTPMRTSLVVGGREVPQSESLGTAEADGEAEGPILPAGAPAAAAAAAAAAGGGGSGGSGAPSLVRQGSFKIKS